MMRYSRAVALMLALSFALCSEGFRLRRAGGHEFADDSRPDIEEPSPVQEEAAEQGHEKLQYTDGLISPSEEDKAGEEKQKEQDAENPIVLVEEEEEEEEEEDKSGPEESDEQDAEESFSEDGEQVEEEEPEEQGVGQYSSTEADVDDETEDADAVDPQMVKSSFVEHSRGDSELPAACRSCIASWKKSPRVCQKECNFCTTTGCPSCLMQKACKGKCATVAYTKTACLNAR